MTSYSHDDAEKQYRNYISPVSALSPPYSNPFREHQQAQSPPPPHLPQPPQDRHGQAPEVHYAAQSPVTHVSNLEQEYKRQYLERRAAEHPAVPNDDTAKEVMPFDETAKVVVPLEMQQHGQYPQTATSTHYSGPWGDGSTTVDDGHSEYRDKRQASTAAGASLPPPPASEKGLGDGDGKKKILGMSRKGFLILLAVLLIIVAAAVGGGVGGAVASTKSKSDNGGAAPAATSTTASTSTTPTSTSASSSSAPTPTHTPPPIFLNNMTAPGSGFAFQGFARDNFSGAYTDIVTKEKGTDFEFDLHSYVWRPRLSSCCLTFCNNATSQGMVGYWCNERNQTSASSSFSRIFVWCGNDHSEGNAKCV
ncbi:hypothetical protein JDV02_000292 [Purpureocillium takamizusanense]|uniref:Uncharacterized protein n=1 Tax=Purpureocillium takamizusanense TaxID=2060973 RepID=A0A9Q8Q6T8_9HYPO|nr:uncharacterized protein JDV02_000292 [Purpureocillium takamizusanense]UNI13561.1 hypothetical protein JDV02_000292 [Purpureocillium takamizusanense]